MANRSDCDLPNLISVQDIKPTGGIWRGSADSIGVSRHRTCADRRDIELQPEFQHLHADLVTVRHAYRTSMDAPVNASSSLNGSVHAIRCCRLSGLIDGGISDAAGPVWRSADRVHIAYASFNALRSGTG